MLLHTEQTMAARHGSAWSGDASLSEQPAMPSGDLDDLAAVAEWLSAQIIRPPDAGMVQAARSVAGQLMLQRMGHMLGCGPDMDRLRRLVASGSSEEVRVALERRHAALFEGIFGYRALMPYASAWDGTGRLCGPAVDRMRALMRRLDIRLADGVGEMPDHLGVQLALMAEAMRRQDREAVAQLLGDMTWVGRFGMALMNTEGNGFYGIFAQILSVFLQQVRLACRPPSGRSDDAE